MPFDAVLRRFPPMAVLLAVTLSAGGAAADLRLLLGGQARDVTTATVAALELELTLAEEGASTASGRFDGDGISGSFQAQGGPVYPCTRGHVCLVFRGTMRQGDVTTAIELAIELPPGLQRAEGVYRVTGRGDDGQPTRQGRFSAQGRDF